MINHLNQNRISNFRKVLSHADGAEAEIKRIVRYSDARVEYRRDRGRRAAH